MAVKLDNEPPQGTEVHKKYGLPNGLGDHWLGVSQLGHENPYAGIFRRDRVDHHRIVVRNQFYEQYKPWTQNQLTTFQIFATGMDKWKGLTEEEKKEYNKEAKHKAIEPVNVFMRQWMYSPEFPALLGREILGKAELGREL